MSSATGEQSECFADAHGPRPGVFSLSDVGTKIDAIFLAQLEPDASTPRGKKILASEQLRTTRYHLTDTTKSNESKSLR